MSSKHIFKPNGNTNESPKHKGVITPGITWGQDPKVEVGDGFVFAIAVVNYFVVTFVHRFGIGVKTFKPTSPTLFVAG